MRFLRDSTSNITNEQPSGVRVSLKRLKAVALNFLGVYGGFERHGLAILGLENVSTDCEVLSREHQSRGAGS